jgi:hypothetical protein
VPTNRGKHFPFAVLIFKVKCCESGPVASD